MCAMCACGAHGIPDKKEERKVANRSNLAYDFSVYEPKKKEAPSRPEIKMKKNPVPVARRQSAFRFIITAMVFLAMLFAVLYGKVETNRLFGDIRDLEEQLDNLKSENITLAAEYEGRTSLKNVEDYAENVLGLKKLDKSQVEYVDLPADTVIEIVETEKRNIFIIIRNWFNELMEKLGA